jgi:hypothetical protein
MKYKIINEGDSMQEWLVRENVKLKIVDPKMQRVFMNKSRKPGLN